MPEHEGMRFIRSRGPVIGTSGLEIGIENARNEERTLRSRLGDKALTKSLPELRRMAQLEDERDEILESGIFTE